MLNIEAKTIPHWLQRYNSSGDWIGCKEIMHFIISDMGNTDYELLIFIHELVEMALCMRRGISEEAVTNFDRKHDGDNPGDDPAAPYHKEHVFASKIEKMVCDEFGVDWVEYNKAFDELKWRDQ